MALIVYAVVFPVSLLFVPSEYVGGRGVLALILLSGVLQSFALFGIYKLTLLRKVLSVPIITLTVLVCNLAMNWSLIPIFGIEGAAISALLSQVLAGTLLVVTAHVVSKRRKQCIP
jgi:O-antigen/teichoic acid export membrane protein